MFRRVLIICFLWLSFGSVAAATDEGLYLSSATAPLPPISDKFFFDKLSERLVYLEVNWSLKLSEATKVEVANFLRSQLDSLSAWKPVTSGDEGSDSLLNLFTIANTLEVIETLDHPHGVVLPETLDDLIAANVENYTKYRSYRKILLALKGRKRLSKKLQETLFRNAINRSSPLNDVAKEVLANKVDDVVQVNTILSPFLDKRILNKDVSKEVVSRFFEDAKKLIHPSSDQIAEFIPYLDSDLKDEAIDALTAIKPRSAVVKKALIEKLGSKKESVRAAVLEILGVVYSNDPLVRETVIDRLTSKSDVIREAAVRALIKSGLKKIFHDGSTVYPELDSIVKAIEAEPYAAVKSLYIDLLSKHAPNETLSQYALARITATTDSDYVRKKAVDALQATNVDGDLAGVLAPLLKSDRFIYRQAGVQLIKDFYKDPAEAQSLLVDFLTDEYPLVRHEAASQLSAMELSNRHWARVRELLDAKKYPDFSYRIPAYRVLAPIAHKDLSTLLVMLEGLNDPAGEVQQEVFELLRQIYTRKGFLGAGTFNLRLMEWAKKGGTKGLRALELLLSDPHIRDFYEMLPGGKRGIEELLIKGMRSKWDGIRNRSLDLVSKIVRRDDSNKKLVESYYDAIANEKTFEKAFAMLEAYPLNLENHDATLMKKRHRALIEFVKRSFKEKWPNTENLGGLVRSQASLETRDSLLREPMDLEIVERFAALTAGRAITGNALMSDVADLMVSGAARNLKESAKARVLILDILKESPQIALKLKKLRLDLQIQLNNSELKELFLAWKKQGIFRIGEERRAFLAFVARGNILRKDSALMLISLAQEDENFAGLYEELSAARKALILPGCD